MLTQLATVKTRLGITDSVNDTILTNALNAISARFDKETNRTLARTANATFEFDGDKTEIVLPIYPVESVSAFHTKSDEATGWVAVSPNPAYLIRKASVISLVEGSIAGSDELARVTYTGGYVLPGTSVGAGQTALPSDLEQACVEQCCYWYQRRRELGLVSIAGEGGSIQQFAQLDLLPSVKAVLKKYERMNL
jgi:hypothetical protein